MLAAKLPRPKPRIARGGVSRDATCGPGEETEKKGQKLSDSLLSQLATHVGYINTKRHT